MNYSTAGRRANRNGHALENKIETALEILELQKIAYIQKTPEPMRQISRPDYKGACTAIYTKKAQPDYKGVLAGGKCVIFEAKFTQSAIINFSRVQPEQLSVLQKYQEFGAAAFVWVGFGTGRDYAILLNDWLMLPERLNKKSANEKDLAQYDVTQLAKLELFFKNIKNS